MNYQRLVLIGNATHDAKQHTSRRGDVKFTTFSIGVSDFKKRKTYVPITAFGTLGSVAMFIKKGQQVFLEGHIEMYGEERRLRVVADNIQLGAQGHGVTQ